MVIGVPESKPLDEAIQMARLHLMQNEILAQLESFGLSSNTKRQVIHNLSPDVIRRILIIADLPLEDPNDAILNASLAVRQDGFIVTVINVATNPVPGSNSPWLTIASSSDNLYEVGAFDSPEYSWFIQKSLCFGT